MSLYICAVVLSSWEWPLLHLQPLGPMSCLHFQALCVFFFHNRLSRTSLLQTHMSSTHGLSFCFSHTESFIFDLLLHQGDACLVCMSACEGVCAAKSCHSYWPMHAAGCVCLRLLSRTSPYLHVATIVQSRRGWDLVRLDGFLRLMLEC